jgi:hypothetical protein
MAAKRTAVDAELALRQAMQIEGIDLEPTREEIEFFLQAEGSTTVGDSAEALARVEQTYADFVAMNRNNPADKFSAETEEEMKRKREKVLETLKERHSGTDA